MEMRTAMNGMVLSSLEAPEANLVTEVEKVSAGHRRVTVTYI